MTDGRIATPFETLYWRLVNWTHLALAEELHALRWGGDQ
jgi:hypothetical protein